MLKRFIIILNYPSTKLSASISANMLQVLSCCLSDFAHGGKYPHDDQLHDLKDCISGACKPSGKCCSLIC